MAMICTRREVHATNSPLPRWRHELICQRRLHTAADMDAVVLTVQTQMIGAGYGERDLFAVRLSLEEAITNALEYGNRHDPRKYVTVRWQVEDQQVVTTVEDQGPGFDPEQIDDPVAPENLRRPSGRGIALMRYYLSSLRYNERGNGVTLCKQRVG